MRSATLAPPPRWRWPLAIVTVVLLHGGALAFLRTLHPSATPDIPQEAVLLDLAPAEPAPAAEPTPPPAPPPTPAPPQVTPPPKPPPPQVTPPPDPAPPDPTPPPAPEPLVPDTVPPPPPPAVIPDKPEVVLPPPPPKPRPPPPPKHIPPPKPRPAPPRRVAAPPPPSAAAEIPPASAPPASAPPAPAPPSLAAPSASAAASAASAKATWGSRIIAHLQPFKRFPAEAERRGFSGVTTMRFTLDGTGHIIAQSMVSSSGHDVLDEEAAAWLQRAQPFPHPPPDTPLPAQFVVPMKFNLQQ